MQDSDLLELEVPDLTARDRLPLLKSPVVPGGEQHGDHGNNGPINVYPEFKRHDDASLLELFFDLCFAANYTIFSQTQAVTNKERFKAYVGYFCLLWLTWFMVTLYDVRYVTDSVFERITRAMQLGVMVGFAVVAPKFDPDDQHKDTMRTMSLILAISRFVLAIEYSSILWHVRKFKRAHAPFYIQIAINAMAGAVYLGITFRFRNVRSRVFVTWYIIGGMEAILTIVLSNFWKVLSFTRTHLMKRMGLLSVVIIGDGIIVVSQNVVLIVKSHNAWDSTTIGLVTAAIATVYCVFLTYFDWMKRSYLPPWRQQLWTSLHLPFHLSLVLFTQGFTQLVVWAKAVHVFKRINIDELLDDLVGLAGAKSHSIASNLTTFTDEFFQLYPPKYYISWKAVDSAVKNVSTISNDFWPALAKLYDDNDDSVFPDSLNDDFELWTYSLNSIYAAMYNSLFEAFGIDLTAENKAGNTNPNSASAADAARIESSVTAKTWDRYALVFAYAYLAAGSTLILMTMLLVVSRVTSWKPWPIARSAIYAATGLALGLVSALYYNEKARERLLQSSWVLPPITFCWAIVMVLTHVGGRSKATLPSDGVPLLDRKDSYSRMGVPLQQWRGDGNQGTTGTQAGGEAMRPTSLYSQTISSDTEVGSYATGQGAHNQTSPHAGYGSHTPLAGGGGFQQSTEYRGARQTGQPSSPYLRD